MSPVMTWFTKKPDPLSERARALNDEIASLESKIKRLDAKLQRNQPQPRLRSTALPRGETLAHAPSPETAPPVENTTVQEPIFEDVGARRLAENGEPASTPAHYNELGVRKYDLPALFARLRNHFRGPSTTNPKLVSYLAAGGIQGLRPLRYEKRVARNRFMALVLALFVVLLGLALVFAKHR